MSNLEQLLFCFNLLVTTQLPFEQYIAMKCLKISCQRQKNWPSVIVIHAHDKLHEICSFLHAHFTEKMKLVEKLFIKLMVKTHLLKIHKL